MIVSALIVSIDYASMDKASVSSKIAKECLQDFSQQKLRSKTVVRVLTKNRMFQAFIDAVPGMHDLFQLGKIRNMVADVASERHKYDLVIVDAPSTGHAQTFLASAETIGEMTRNGIIEDEARTISDFLKNPDHTSLVLVTQPDAMPVNETLEFARALQPTTPQIGAIILNRSVAYPLASVPPWSAVKPMLLEQQRHALVRLGDRVQHRQHQAAAARSRIRHGISPTRHPSMTVMDIPDHGPGLSLGHLPDLATAFIAQSSSAS